MKKSASAEKQRDLISDAEESSGRSSARAPVERRALANKKRSEIPVVSRALADVKRVSYIERRAPADIERDPNIHKRAAQADIEREGQQKGASAVLERIKIPVDRRAPADIERVPRRRVSNRLCREVATNQQKIM